MTGLHWHRLNTIDKRRLAPCVGGFEPEAVRRSVMDEFALHKGHRYTRVSMRMKRVAVSDGH